MFSMISLICITTHFPFKYFSEFVSNIMPYLFSLVHDHPYTQCFDPGKYAENEFLTMRFTKKNSEGEIVFRIQFDRIFHFRFFHKMLPVNPGNFDRFLRLDRADMFTGTATDT